jgi:hypothetical protein
VSQERTERYRHFTQMHANKNYVSVQENQV